MEDYSSTLLTRLTELRACLCSIQLPPDFDSPNNSLTSSAELTLNLTSNETFFCRQAASEANASASNPFYRHVEEILYTRVAVAICIFGLLGNICNLFVLVPQGRRSSMGRIEKFAYWGLVSLSVSDGCCCLLVIPHVYVDRDTYYSTSLSFPLLYAVYGTALLNVFTMVSTWLTVITAVGRYLAICHPFRARELIGRTVARRAGLIVYCACLAFNIPRFMTYIVERIDCEGGLIETTLFRWPGRAHAKSNPQFESAYNWIYFVVGICVPFVFLVVSNAFLVRALRRARSALSLRRAAEVCSADQFRSITLTLVVVVLMHVVLVSPAEFVMYFRQRLTRLNDDEDDGYNLLAAVCNTLQAINFSGNFVLYYVINVHFRRALAALVRCRCFDWQLFEPRGGGSGRTKMAAGSERSKMAAGSEWSKIVGGYERSKMAAGNARNKMATESQWVPAYSVSARMNYYDDSGERKCERAEWKSLNRNNFDSAPF